MPNVDIKTLAIAIRAIDSEMTNMEKQLAALLPDQGADLEILLLDYSNAAEKLKNAYIEAVASVSNFPAYEKLVRS